MQEVTDAENRALGLQGPPADAAASSITPDTVQVGFPPPADIVPHTGLEPYMGDDDGRLGPLVKRTKRAVAQVAVLIGVHITPDEVNLQTEVFRDYLQSAASSSGHADDAPPHASQGLVSTCLLYTSPSPRDQRGSRMPSSA